MRLEAVSHFWSTVNMLMNNLTVICMSSMVALKKYCSLSYLNNRKLFSHNSGHLKSKAHGVKRIGLC